MEKKICPLTYSVGKGGYDQEIANFDYCVEKRCAWWDKTEKECSIPILAKFLKGLQ